MRRRQARTSQGLTAPASRWEHGESRPASALTRRGFLGVVAGALLAPGLHVEAIPATPPGAEYEAFVAGRTSLTVLGMPVHGWPVLHGSERIIRPEDFFEPVRVVRIAPEDAAR